jgi:hypothetical protein
VLLLCFCSGFWYIYSFSALGKTWQYLACLSLFLGNVSKSLGILGGISKSLHSIAGKQEGILEFGFATPKIRENNKSRPVSRWVHRFLDLGSLLSARTVTTTIRSLLPRRRWRNSAHYFYNHSTCQRSNRFANKTTESSPFIMSFTEELRAAAGDQWERVVNHKFTTELASGEIDRNGKKR